MNLDILKSDFRNLNAWEDDINLKCKCLKGCHFLHSTLHEENELQTCHVAWFQDFPTSVIITKLFKINICSLTTIHFHRHPTSMTSNHNSSNAVNNYEEQRKDVTQ